MLEISNVNGNGYYEVATACNDDKFAYVPLFNVVAKTQCLFPYKALIEYDRPGDVDPSLLSLYISIQFLANMLHCYGVYQMVNIDWVEVTIDV